MLQRKREDATSKLRLAALDQPRWDKFPVAYTGERLKANHGFMQQREVCLAWNATSSTREVVKCCQKDNFAMLSIWWEKLGVENKSLCYTSHIMASIVRLLSLANKEWALLYESCYAGGEQRTLCYMLWSRRYRTFLRAPSNLQFTNGDDTNFATCKFYITQNHTWKCHHHRRRTQQEGQWNACIWRAKFW